MDDQTLRVRDKLNTRGRIIQKRGWPVGAVDARKRGMTTIYHCLIYLLRGKLSMIVLSERSGPV